MRRVSLVARGATARRVPGGPISRTRNFVAPAQEEEQNFNPLIRLIFGLDKPDTSERVTASQWAQAMRALHSHYEQDPAFFGHNPQGKLFDHAKKHGSVSGLAESIKKPPLPPV